MNDKEYLMLREEILHLSTLENNTINFFIRLSQLF